MRKICLSLVLLLGAGGASFAQMNLNLFSSANQRLIEESVRDGLLLLRQEYQLEDTVTAKRYTWDNRPEFGSSVSMCVLTRDGCILSDKALRPWEYDSRYEEYRNTQYRPVLTRTYCRTVRDSAYRAAAVPRPEGKVSLAADGWTQATDSLFGGKGFVTDRGTGRKDGWLVWLTAAEGRLSEPVQLSLEIYRHPLTLEEDKECYPIPAPATQKTVVGGIYVEPQYHQIGTVVFALLGIVVEGEDGWQLVRVADTEAGGLTASPDDRAAGLTPAAPGDSGQEQDGDGQPRKNRRQRK